MIDQCTHENAVQKRYVGTNEKYFFCPDCYETFEGEETPEKRELIQSAALAEELIPFIDLDGAFSLSYV